MEWVVHAFFVQAVEWVVHAFFVSAVEWVVHAFFVCAVEWVVHVLLINCPNISVTVDYTLKSNYLFVQAVEWVS